MRKWIFGLSLLLLVLVAFTALYRESPKPFAHITLQTDSTFIPGIVQDVIYLYEDEYIDGPQYYYDTATDDVEERWDSTRTGHYTIELKSVFMLSYKEEYDVNSDTTLYVPNRFGLVGVDTFTLNDLYQADTVECIYISKGCFHYSLSRTSLVRTESGYAMYEKPSDDLPVHVNVSEETGRATLERIHQQFLLAEQFRTQHNGFSVSTSTRRMFIRVDDKAYVYVDDSGWWPGCEL